ncbi:conserved hypothetical protein [Ricinus communis]|uniref:Uncharacterized protein n=1 Tax=Ricinus communis TaxID=3988 RepID=B9SPS1_RICCO|nr:conserved hypothetical protein [Ricinus communis]
MKRVTYSSARWTAAVDALIISSHIGLLTITEITKGAQFKGLKKCPVFLRHSSDVGEIIGE